MSKRILVVDDSVTVRDMLMTLLQDAEYGVATASNAKQAIDLLQTERYEIIITDLEMPEMEGFSLIKAISELDWDPAVILVSGDDSRILYSAREMALAYSVNLLGTLSKPIEPQALSSVLNDVAATRSRTQPGAETVLAESEFMRGLMSDGLSPVFQPKIDVASKSLAGAEVFARWKAPGGGLLGAGAVVRVAREKGYMDVLTYRMLELALEQQGKWRREGQEVALSINVASENLRKEDFADVVTQLADQFEVKPAMVRLELAESDFTIDERTPLEVMAQLSRRGFGLALDDFGTGFASLMRLQSIPFDEMIIDREFVGRAHADKTARIILETAIELSHKLGLKCTCEGIEDEEHLKMVVAMGADTVQGYYIGKPMSSAEFLIWLEDYQAGVISVEGLG